MRLALIFCCLLCSFAQADTVKVPGGTFEINWRSNFTAAEQENIRAWLRHGAESTALVNGRFPLTTTNILVQRARRGSGPVPWGNTIRNTHPQGVSFHVKPASSFKDLVEDWTITHEFSHLFLPYPGRDDIWISEGFASYYQHILMMRKGTLSEQVGWQKFADGFARGAADPNQSVSLDTASREMRQRRAFKRVYWSGAHYFLEADLHLRANGSSLDQVISNFLICCRHQNTRWTGIRLATALDKAAATELFVPLFQQYEGLTRIPDYQSTFEQLGIRFDGRAIILSEDPDQSKIRRGISARRSLTELQ
tara:strand:+ start:1532 stop:2458 length:927 start_codon:yes stop_codon:yes gene_type:complete